MMRLLFFVYTSILLCTFSFGFFFSFGRVKFLVASGREDVIPLHELADIAEVNAVAVPSGKGDVIHEVSELRFGSRLVGELRLCAIEGVADVLENLHERNVVRFGVHRNVRERSNAIARTSGDATLVGVERFYDEVAVATSHELIEAGLASDGEKGILHNLWV